MAKKIISSGHNVALLRVRNAMIQQAGYEVVTSKESAIILEMIEKQDFAAAVLCNSIPVHLRVHLSREIKKLKPALPLIIIFSEGEEQQLHALADHLVPSIHDAQVLLEAVTKAAGEPDPGLECSYLSAS
jgi:DNA-binding NtrC family response regulator